RRHRVSVSVHVGAVHLRSVGVINMEKSVRVRGRGIAFAVADHPAFSLRIRAVTDPALPRTVLILLDIDVRARPDRRAVGLDEFVAPLRDDAALVVGLAGVVVLAGIGIVPAAILVHVRYFGDLSAGLLQAPAVAGHWLP